MDAVDVQVAHSESSDILLMRKVLIPPRPRRLTRFTSRVTFPYAQDSAEETSEEHREQSEAKCRSSSVNRMLRVFQFGKLCKRRLHKGNLKGGKTPEREGQHF